MVNKSISIIITQYRTTLIYESTSVATRIIFYEFIGLFSVFYLHCSNRFLIVRKVLYPIFFFLEY